ncbi:MAG: hypothetical protein L6428_11205 [Candidatus Aminicenantes bacterium]|nr:hypothetical protein [Candidatus Aminicenantes bacterium]
MTDNSESLSWKFYALNIVVLGAILAVVEIALGGFIKKAGLPLRSAVVTGVGFAVLALGLALFKQPRVIPGITVMGIFSKWLAVPLLGLPIFCQANALLAVLLNGAFLYAGVALFRKQVGKGWPQRSAAAFGSALGSGAAFFVLGRFVAPCRHLLSFNYAGGPVAYLLTRVLPAALLAAVFFPLGYALGRRLEKRLLPLWLSQKSLLVPLAAAFTLACWGLSVLLTATGF